MMIDVFGNGRVLSDIDSLAECNISHLQVPDWSAVPVKVSHAIPAREKKKNTLAWKLPRLMTYVFAGKTHAGDSRILFFWKSV